MVMPSGLVAVAMLAGVCAVSVPVSVLRVYWLMLLVTSFVAYTLLPSGLTTTHSVYWPAAIVAGLMGVSVPLSLLRVNCETVPEKVPLATYTLLPSGLMARSWGLIPAATVAGLRA